MCFPNTKSENFSHAQIAARASFSTCMYCYSVCDIEQDAKTTGLHRPSVFCSSTAPKPYAEASAEILVEERLMWVWIVIPFPGQMPLTGSVPSPVP